MHSYDLAKIVADIEARRQDEMALVVAVDGPSGSGKTRLARRIGRALGEFTLVRMDHVVPGWDGLEESTRIIRPALDRLRRRSPAEYRLWDWDRDDWGQNLQRPAAATIVIEGCGSGSQALSDLVDYLIWMDAPPDLRRERAVTRDGASNDYAASWRHWAEQERTHFAANETRERADLCLDGRRPVR